jgi:hypothetical protein
VGPWPSEHVGFPSLPSPGSRGSQSERMIFVIEIAADYSLHEGERRIVQSSRRSYLLNPASQFGFSWSQFVLGLVQGVRVSAVSGVGVAKQGLWAELQRERAQRERIRQREFREFQQTQSRAAREAAKAERDGKRQAAADERERKKLYVEDRKAEAEDMAEDVRARLAELDGLLKAGVRDRPVLTFAALKRTDAYPAFDAGQLGRALPPPLWEDSVPAPPTGLGK